MMRRLICVITICVIIASVFSGCALLQKLGLQNSNDKLHPVSSTALTEEEASKFTNKVPVHLYFANEKNTKLLKEIRYIPVSEAKNSSSLATAIVNELIKGPSSKSGLKATVPKGTKLKSKVSIDIAKATATVDLSGEFVKNHPGGRDAERATIYSIVNSLTELKEVQKVKFLIDGKSKSEYKGSFQFNAPFPRTVALIDSDAVPTTSGLDSETKETGKTDSVKNDKANGKDTDASSDEWIGDVEETFGEESIDEGK